MIRFNTGSFRFRMAASYVAIGLLFAAFVTASFVMLKKLDALSEKTVQINALSSAARQLTNDISKSNVSIVSFLTLERPEDREKWTEAFRQSQNSIAILDSLTKVYNVRLSGTICKNAAKVLQEQERVEKKFSEIETETIEIAAFEDEETSFGGEDEDFLSGEDEDSFFEEDETFSQPQEQTSTNGSKRALLTDYQSNVAKLLDGVFSETSQFVETLEDDKKQAEELSKEILTKIIRLIISAFLILTFIFLVSYRKATEGMRKSIKSARDPLRMLSAGDIPPVQGAQNDEIGEIIQEINVLTQNLSKIKDFAVEVGAGRNDTEINVFNNEGEIGKTLWEMRNSLKQIAADEKIRNWMNEGFAAFAEILRRNGENLKVLSQNVVSQMVRYLEANQAGIFIINNSNPEDITLELTACYAYERQKYLKKQVKPGEGLVGQCYLEKQSIYLAQTPEDYIKITSGLGGARPRNLFIAPLKFKDDVYGVIEIASFRKFEPHEMEFVEKTAESIASAISSVQTTERTNKLLEESQLVTEQLRAQEEEMRQNLEELAATQEEMHRNQKSLAENEQKTRLIYLNAFDAIITLNGMGQIDLFNPAAERIFGYDAESVKGKHVGMLLPDEYAGHHERMFSGNADFSKVIGLSRIVGAKRRNGEKFKIQLKVEEGMVGTEKMYLAFISEVSGDSTQGFDSEQKLAEMRSRLAAEETALAQRLSDARDKLKKHVEEEDFLLRKSIRKGK